MDVHLLLEQAAGEWQGEYKLWFRPGEQPDGESPTRATITRELHGCGLLMRYDWRYEGITHDGLAIIGLTEDDGLQMGWSDTFHYKHGVMHNEAVGTTAAVLGHYGPADAPWGWRTEFDMPSPDALEIRAFNILPDGTEALATVAIYARVS